ncbi:MAG TPA: hypothetical protein GXX75_11325 [Clostridiales bacterium]|nr:hypothetical protein [Clostridiales bacterium]
MKISMLGRFNHEIISAYSEQNDTGKALFLTYEGLYREGDYILFSEISVPFVNIKVDDFIAETTLYVPKGEFVFKIPYGIASWAYHYYAFVGEVHHISICETSAMQLMGSRNISENPLDQKDNMLGFPHVTANTVTRGEPWFEPRNAIDGIINTESHGPYPFCSWGVGYTDDVSATVDFGRDIIAEECVIILRNDQYKEHDANWLSGRLLLSDGTDIPLAFSPLKQSYNIPLEGNKINRLTITDLKRPNGEKYCALTQIQVFGKEV